jgi:hypothetical protein
MFRIGSIRNIFSKHAAFFDLHEAYGLIYVVKESGRSKLFANDVLWNDWAETDFPHLLQVKWLSDKTAILWFAPRGAIIMSNQNNTELLVGPASEVIVSKQFLFTAYGEEAVLSAAPEEYEFNIVSAFTKSGDFACGLAKLASAIDYEGVIVEVSNCYSFGDRLIFLAYQTNYVWTLDAQAKSVRRTPAVPFLHSSVVGVLGNDETCWILSRSAAGPLFSIAVDLAGGAISRDDTGLARLVSAAGFKPHCLSFASAYDGKAIVSDGEIVGILELSA